MRRHNYPSVLPNRLQGEETQVESDSHSGLRSSRRCKEAKVPGIHRAGRELCGERPLEVEEPSLSLQLSTDEQVYVRKLS